MLNMDTNEKPNAEIVPTPCHPYDEVCGGPGGPCRNHGGTPPAAEIVPIHWGSEKSRPTSLHGNGAASFERTSLDWAEVTCKLCRSLREIADGNPYGPLDAHIVSVKALYCEDGCGEVETSGYGDDQDAAEELSKRGWVVRPHSLGGFTSLCKPCAEVYDREVEEDNDDE